MKVEIHILQNLPPANLNRNDTGQPKDCEFGGIRRARISSQCLKRSIRTSDAFHSHLQDRIAIRTKRSAEPLAKRLVEQHGHDPETAKPLAEAVVGSMLGWDEAKGQTKVLFYVGYGELDRLAELIHGQAEDLTETLHALRELPEDSAKKDREAAEKAFSNAVGEAVKRFKNEQKDHVRAVDIALFGRMLAEAPDLNIDAACQVAHAISTNKVDMDFDYFTAVDDLNPDEETGAGMIGTTGFNSSCFYRYALIDADQLAENLGGDRGLAAEGIRAFLAASYQAIPTGKQNSFAAQTPPSLFMVVVKSNRAMPWSLANAFAAPVRPSSDRGLIEAFVQALDEQWDELSDMYGTDSMKVFLKVGKRAGTVEHLASHQVENVPAVIEKTAEALLAWVGGNGA